ncbi:hypothetical protein NIA69_11050 [Gemmiger formicilis]|nr:hypothetical protein [Gemmiger formicilis]
MSRTTDLTACVAIIEKDARLNVLAHFFLPPRSCKRLPSGTDYPMRRMYSAASSR